MRRLMRDGGHLMRLAGIFAAGALVFLILRGILVPADFGQYGHYRGKALTEARALPMHFAGKAACLDCHSDVADSQKGSHHERLSCETCHGALEKHVEDGGTTKPAKLDVVPLCLSCHQVKVGRPASFPQVDPKMHYDGGECTGCHKPHHPEPEG